MRALTFPFPRFCSFSLFCTFCTNPNRVRSSKRNDVGPFRPILTKEQEQDRSILTKEQEKDRSILTKEQEQEVLKELRERRVFLTQSNSQSGLQSGARSVSISQTNPRDHLYVDITYGPGLVKLAAVDTGGMVLIMDDFEALIKAQPGIVVISEGYTPWNNPAKFVEGNFTLHVTNSDGSQEDLPFETKFWACSPKCSNNNIATNNNLGLSNGLDSLSPFKNQSGIEHITFDLPKDGSRNDRMILQPAYECNDLDKLGIDDRNYNGVAFSFVFVNSLKVEGVQTEWAKGTNGPPQYADNNGTMEMFETGGGPMFLATENIPGFPPIPPPQSDQSNCLKNWPGSGCYCYYGDVEFQLQSANSNVTKDIRWTNDDVAGVNGDETFIGCEKASLGGGNYVNLGTVMFVLNKITLSVNTFEVCVESTEGPTEGPTPQLTTSSPTTSPTTSPITTNPQQTPTTERPCEAECVFTKTCQEVCVELPGEVDVSCEEVCSDMYEECTFEVGRDEISSELGYFTFKGKGGVDCAGGSTNPVLGTCSRSLLDVVDTDTDTDTDTVGCLLLSILYIVLLDTFEISYESHLSLLLSLLPLLY